MQGEKKSSMETLKNLEKYKFCRKNVLKVVKFTKIYLFILSV